MEPTGARRTLTLTLTLTLILTLTLTRCKYCRLQRALFGTEGAAALPYVECAANGFGAQKCPPEVDGFPTWKVHGHTPRAMLP